MSTNETTIHGPLVLSLPTRSRTVLAEEMRPGDGTVVLTWLGAGFYSDDDVPEPSSRIRFNGHDWRVVTAERIPEPMHSTPKLVVVAVREADHRAT